MALRLHTQDRRIQQCQRVEGARPKPRQRPARSCPILHRRSVCVASVDSQRPPIPAASSPLVERTFDNSWRTPLPGHDHPEPRQRPILALGKFDAMHKGHQALAAAALQLGGSPVLLSFSGMAAVLGWQPRKPLVAPCDRPRVLHLWAQQLHGEQAQQQHAQQQGLPVKKRPATQQQQPADGADSDHSSSDVVPVRQRYIPFDQVRSMSPEAFVELITRDFGAAGVVCGANYRFGYRASGDTALLQRLCGAAGLPVAVVELVGAAEPGAVGVVSSSKIREMLASRRMEAVKRSLGRSYRLVAALTMGGQLHRQQQWWRHWQQQRALLLQQPQQPTSSGSSAEGSNQAGVRVSAVASEALQASYQGAFIQAQCLLNQQPGPGIFACDVQLFIGATAHDDLLLLQQAAQQASEGSNGGSGGSSSIEVLPQLAVAGSTCWACVRGWQQEVQCFDEGLLLPWDLLAAAQACVDNSRRSSGSSTSSRSSSLDAGMGAGVDPVCWDTDDNEEVAGEVAGAAAAGGTPIRVLGSDDFTTAAAAAAAAVEGPGLLVVLDFEQCLQQVCSVPTDWLDGQQ